MANTPRSEEEKKEMLDTLREQDPPRSYRNRSMAMSDHEWERIARIAAYYGSSKSDAIRTMARYFEVHLGLGGSSPANPRDMSRKGRKKSDVNTDSGGSG